MKARSAGEAAAETGDVRVGTAGWAYDDWEGTVYPGGRAAGFDRLEYLSRFFDCVEINSSFYRIPEPRVSASWARKVRRNERFRFTLKLHRGFTHEPFEEGGEEAAAFRRGIEPLGDTGVLGAVLMQFPWSFKNIPANRARLERLIELFDGFPLVCEVRHASWNAASFYAFLGGRGVGFCNIDQPVFRNSISPSAQSTSAVGYVRLHGRNYDNWFREGAGRDARYDYLYSREELGEWVRRIESLRVHVSSVYVITNNHFKGQAACNALEIKALLSRAPVPAPQSLVAAFPVLRTVAAPADGQAELW